MWSRVTHHITASWVARKAPIRAVGWVDWSFLLDKLEPAGKVVLQGVRMIVVAPRQPNAVGAHLPTPPSRLDQQGTAQSLAEELFAQTKALDLHAAVVFFLEFIVAGRSSRHVSDPRLQLPADPRTQSTLDGPNRHGLPIGIRAPRPGAGTN